MKSLYTILIVLSSLNGPILSQWQKTSAPDNISNTCFTIHGRNILAGWGSGLDTGGVLISLDDGLTWAPLLASERITSIAVDLSGMIYAGCSFFHSPADSTGVVYIRNVLTGNWIRKKFRDPVLSVTVNSSGVVYAGLTSWVLMPMGSIFRSTDNGMHWKKIDSSMAVHVVYCTPRQTIIASGEDPTLMPITLRSTNGGSTWMHSSVEWGGAQSIVSINDSLMYGIDAGFIYSSRDDGASWHLTSSRIPIGGLFSGFSVLSEKNIYCAINNDTLLHTTDQGHSWQYEYPGATQTITCVTQTPGGRLLIGTDRGGVFRSQPISNVVSNRTLVETYVLQQNYPNPFNPSTVISYHLPAGQAGLPVVSKVTLRIYDVLRREVATLVNEEQSAGWKEVEWNGKDISTGIYFYKIEAVSGGNKIFVETKKCIVIK